MAGRIAPVVEDLAEVCTVDLAVEVNVGGGVVALICGREDEPWAYARRLGVRPTIGPAAAVYTHVLHPPITPSTNQLTALWIP